MAEPVRYETCPHCGETFRAKEKIVATGANATAIPIRRDVREIKYAVHHKRDAPPEAPRTLRVEYRVGDKEWVREWVCVEHQDGGFANRKARKWWAMRSEATFPDDADEAARIGREGGIAHVSSIVVTENDETGFSEIDDHDIGPKPKWTAPKPMPEYDEEQRSFAFDDDDIPF